MESNLNTGNLILEKDISGTITRVLLNQNGHIKQLCGPAYHRIAFLEPIYSYMMRDLGKDFILECGIGTGKILQYIEEYKYTIVEINTELYNIFKDTCTIINDDYFNHLKINEYSNTAFVIRSMFIQVDEFTEFLGKFSNQLNSGNILCIESIKSLDIENLKTYTLDNGFKTYIIEL